MKKEVEEAAPPQLLPPPPPPPAQASTSRGGAQEWLGCSRSRSPSRHMQSERSIVKKEGDRFQSEPGNGRVAGSSEPVAVAPLIAAASAQPQQLPPPPPPPQATTTTTTTSKDTDQGVGKRAHAGPGSAAASVNKPGQVVSVAVQPCTTSAATVQQLQVMRQVSSHPVPAAADGQGPKLVLPPQRTSGVVQPPRPANVTPLAQRPQQPRFVPTPNKQTTPAAKPFAPVVQNQPRPAPYPPQRIQPPPRAG